MKSASSLVPTSSCKTKRNFVYTMANVLMLEMMLSVIAPILALLELDVKLILMNANQHPVKTMVNAIIWSTTITALVYQATKARTVKLTSTSAKHDLVLTAIARILSMHTNVNVSLDTTALIVTSTSIIVTA